MIQWEYNSEILRPGESQHDTLRSRGQDGWEAWHIEKMHDGGRKIFFKRLTHPAQNTDEK